MSHSGDCVGPYPGNFVGRRFNCLDRLDPLTPRSNGSIQRGLKSLIGVDQFCYHSFAGEVEASKTSTIRRLTPSRRHQLSPIAPQRERKMQSVLKCIVGAMIALGSATSTVQAQQCSLYWCRGLPEDIQVRLQQYCLFKSADPVCGAPRASASTDPSASEFNPDNPGTEPPPIPIPGEYFEREQPPVNIAPFQIKLSACPGCPGHDFLGQLSLLHYCVRYRHGAPANPKLVKLWCGS